MPAITILLFQGSNAETNSESSHFKAATGKFFRLVFYSTYNKADFVKLLFMK